MDSVDDETRKNELWQCFEDTQAEMAFIREDFAPGQHDYDKGCKMEMKEIDLDDIPFEENSYLNVPELNDEMKHALHANVNGPLEYQAYSLLQNLPTKEPVDTFRINSVSLDDVKKKKARRDALKKQLQNIHLHQLLFSDQSGLWRHLI